MLAPAPIKSSSNIALRDTNPMSLLPPKAILGEKYAFLLRQRCKEAGITNELVPQHPVGWQFTDKIQAMKRGKSRVANKLSRLVNRPRINKMRA